MTTLEVEALALDYPVKDVEGAFRNSKKYFPTSFYYDTNIALSEYGSVDRMRMASLYYCIEQTGSLAAYSSLVRGFVGELRKETYHIKERTMRMSTFDFDILDEYFPPTRSAEEEYLHTDFADPHLYTAGGIKLNALTRKQRDALETFASTGSRKETGRLMGISAVAVKQLLQRARKALT